ncbi:MAG: pilin [Spiribacter sp.]|nr:pilin [Spiribacter sp.]
MRNHQSGFTLIELMIVVAIVGILASVAVPAYSDYTVRAKVSEAVAAVAPVKASVADYYYGNGELPGTAEEAGLDTGGDPAGSNYTTDVIDTIVMDANAGAGSIKVTINETLSDEITAGDSIIFTPTETTAGQLEWDCTGSTLPARFAPASCRG